jgi:outer membrane protein assembly factor BamB
VQYDQGAKEEDGKSALIAFDGATGKQLWRTRRFVANSWASPLVIYPQNAAAQIVAAGRPWVIGYDAATGTELWKASLLDADVAASPAFAAGKVFVANEQARLAAIAIDGKGDVTQTHVAWTAEDGLPDMVSPLATNDFVLLINSSGTATCYSAADGAKRWEHDLNAGFHASPVLAGKNVYAIDTKGVMHIFEAAPAFKEIGAAAIGEEVDATPAFVGNRIFIRGKSNLYCIGEGRK